MKIFNTKNESGFTLLEILIVVAVLVTLAGGAMLALGGVQNDAALQVSRAEMLEVKDALLRFRTDTGFLPRQGPFELAASDGGPCSAGAVGGQAPLPAGKPPAWFCSPVNFDPLYTNPLAGTGHPLETWQPDTGRGFRGPYLTQHGEGLVDAGDALLSDGAGDPVTGGLLSEMRGVSDPFIGDPVSNPGGTYLVWRTTPTGTPHTRWGRPYFMFDLDDQGTSDTKEARIVGMGPNGQYDCDRGGAAGCDAADNDGAIHDLCVPPPNSDDLVLCLFK